MTKNSYAVKVRDVKKSFYLPHHKNNSLKSTITQAFKSKEKGGEMLHALDGISFNIEKGDFFGILGRNGSGKSTLLKIISEIYRPTSGSVHHSGKLVSFIELGVGFKAELTGRENVYLNGALLGFSKDEMAKMYDEIVEFAELERFMDQKLKNYSSGMKVRLAFSVAIRAKADILILDEVLAVGDASFQQKCGDYFETLKNDGKTVVLVTHSMGNVRKFCNRAVVIEGGKVIFDGGPDDAADEYLRLFEKTKEPAADEPLIEAPQYANIDAAATIVGSEIEIDFTITPLKRLDDPIVAILIHNKGTNQVFRWVSDEDAPGRVALVQDTPFHATLRLQNIFPVGLHKVDILVKSADRETTYATRTRIAEFTVENTSEHRYRTLWQPRQSFTIHDENQQ